MIPVGPAHCSLHSQGHKGCQYKKRKGGERGISLFLSRFPWWKQRGLAVEGCRDAQPRSYSELFSASAASSQHPHWSSLHPTWTELLWSSWSYAPCRSREGNSSDLLKIIPSVQCLESGKLCCKDGETPYLTHAPKPGLLYLCCCFYLATPHWANFQDLCRVMQCLEHSSTADLSGAAQASFVTRDGDGLLCFPTTLPGPTETVPFPFSLPQGWSLHISRGVHFRGEPSLGAMWLVHSSTRISMWQVLGDPSPLKHLKRIREAPALGAQHPVWNGWRQKVFCLQTCELGLCTDFCFLCSVFISEAGAGRLILL